MWRIAIFAELLVFGTGLIAQTISYGVQGGALLTGPPDLSPIVHREDRRYTIGPLVEVSVPGNFAVEFSPLYKRLGFTQTISVGTSFFPVGTTSSGPAQAIISQNLVLRQRVNAWEFPLVAKYYFGSKRRPFRPLVLTGYSFTKSWTTMTQSGSAIVSISGSGSPSTSLTLLNFPPSSFTSPLGVGAVFGGGIVSRKGPVDIGTELRYTRNGVSGKNQTEVLVSVRF